MRFQLGRKDSGKQDLYIEFKNGAVNVLELLSCGIPPSALGEIFALSSQYVLKTCQLPSKVKVISIFLYSGKDVLGGGFGKVLTAEGQQFALDITIGETQYISIFLYSGKPFKLPLVFIPY